MKFYIKVHLKIVLLILLNKLALNMKEKVIVIQEQRMKLLILK